MPHLEQHSVVFAHIPHLLQHPDALLELGHLLQVGVRQLVGQAAQARSQQGLGAHQRHHLAQGWLALAGEGRPGLRPTQLAEEPVLAGRFQWFEGPACTGRASQPVPSVQ